MGLIPLIGVVSVIQSKVLSGMLTESKKQYEDAAKIIADTLGNLKTVLSFCYEAKTI